MIEFVVSGDSTFSDGNGRKKQNDFHFLHDSFSSLIQEAEGTNAYLSEGGEPDRPVGALWDMKAAGQRLLIYFCGALWKVQHTQKKAEIKTHTDTDKLTDVQGDGIKKKLHINFRFYCFAHREPNSYSLPAHYICPTMGVRGSKRPSHRSDYPPLSSQRVGKEGRLVFDSRFFLLHVGTDLPRRERVER